MSLHSQQARGTTLRQWCRTHPRGVDLVAVLLGCVVAGFDQVLARSTTGGASELMCLWLFAPTPIWCVFGALGREIMPVLRATGLMLLIGVASSVLGLSSSPLNLDSLAICLMAPPISAIMVFFGGTIGLVIGAGVRIRRAERRSGTCLGIGARVPRGAAG